MNIFVTNEDPVLAPKDLDDKRLNKMILETAQILCTAIHMSGGTATYKPTHKHHPCVVWTSVSKKNYQWLLTYFTNACAEYENRFNKIHKCKTVLLEELTEGIKYINDGELTRHPNCTTNKKNNISFVHMDNITLAYRNYLKERWKYDTMRPKWTNVTPPCWFAEVL